MNSYPQNDENTPVLWIRGYALYTAHVIVLTLTVSMVFTAILSGTGGRSLLGGLMFTGEAVWRGEIWRIFSYGLVNSPSLVFVVEMFMTAIFGRELERFFGRRVFLQLYTCLYLLPPLLLALLSKWFDVSLVGVSGAFALFVAFAALYPNAVMLFNLLAKWVALALFGLYTLIAFSQQNFVQLLSLWVTTGFAYFFVRYEQGRIALPRFTNLFAKESEKVTSRKHAQNRVPNKASSSEIDTLLDKIAQYGLHSLTKSERAKLEESSRSVTAERTNRLKKS